jgi:peptidylprolyl isomerase
MGKAKNGDTVKVHYTGRFDDGTVFDSSAKGGGPLEFTIGEAHVISGFEEAVTGMVAGDSKTVSIAPDEAYGPHHGELVFKVEPGDLPPNIDPEVGQQLQFQRPDGQVVALTVTDVSDATVTLDANHPLAGKELIFDLELIEIVAPLE